MDNASDDELVALSDLKQKNQNYKNQNSDPFESTINVFGACSSVRSSYSVVRILNGRLIRFIALSHTVVWPNG